MTVQERLKWMYQLDIPMPKEWNREEILRLYETYEFGVTPSFSSENTDFSVDSEEITDFGAVCKKISVVLKREGKEYSYPITLYHPEGKEKSPAFLMVTKQLLLDRYLFMEEGDTGFFPVQSLIQRGYAAIVLNIDGVARDNQEDFEDFKDGLYRFLDIQESDDSIGAIGLWAFSACRVMDCLERMPEIDATRVAVVGHSRFGKTALWTGAQDERFLLSISNNSGCGGAANFRIKGGERIAFMKEVVPYWFCRNYRNFAFKEEELPFDQHMLIGLMAPRHVYVASSNMDYWADPDAEFISTLLAVEIYEKVCGEESFDATEIPAADSAVFGDRIAYHVKSGGHSLTYVDWEYYLDYMDGIIQ